MNRPLVTRFLAIAFLFMLPTWGGCALLIHFLELPLDNPVTQMLYFFGSFSPTIASYVALKQTNKVEGLKDWALKVFDVKHHIVAYLFVIALTAVYYAMGCLSSGYMMGVPAGVAILLLPSMLIEGAKEETGWRMILHPELEKQFGFFPAALITGLFWWVWYTPAFYIPGTPYSALNFWWFGLSCLALSVGLGLVRRLTNGVFLCILMRGLINVLSIIFIFPFTLQSGIATLAVMLLAAIAALHWEKSRAKKNSISEE